MLISDVGMTLLPWQNLVLGDLAARDEMGRPSYVTLGLDVPRQNGKNAILEAYELFVVAVCGWHVVHTAHRVKTVKKSFRRLAKYFEDDAHPELKSLVRQIRRTNGEEAVYLENGGYVEFMARTNGGGRGFDDVQLVVFDEAQELTDAQYDSIMYTLSASSTGERQIVYTGTPPNDSSPGTVFARVRRSILGGGVRKTCWDSWATPDLPPRDATFEGVLDLVYEANPSMGYFLDEEFTETEFAGGSVEGFAHERLDWWSPVAAAEAKALPKGEWEAARIDAIGSRYTKKTALCVKFSPDGATYALAGCKLGAKGAAVELIELGSTAGGTKALAQVLYERRGRASCVVVDGLSNADALCDNLRELNAPRGYVVRMATRDVIAAASGFRDALHAKTLAHTGQPALTDSATGCVRRSIGSRGGWGFGPTETHDSIAVEAAAGALWGARTSRRNPKRRQRVL